MILLLAAPAARAGTRHGWAEPVRDTVLAMPGLATGSIAASAATARYPIEDGSGATIAVAVTTSCQALCTAADPQQIADFIGTLIHGPEVRLLSVQLDTPNQLGFDCGFGAQACYFTGLNRIVISGNDTPGPDGASRGYVLAHEYGHHLARHRKTPAPFPAAIDWGTARWSSYEHVCQRHRAGLLFPGNEGTHYYQDPGEAFAESFARYRFPEDHVRWKWSRALMPNVRAFQAIREDTLEPWSHRTRFVIRGRVPRRRGHVAVESFPTPLDGTVSLRSTPPPGNRYLLRLVSKGHRVLGTSRHRLELHRQLNYTVCGQPRLRVTIRSTGRAGGAFRLQVRRP
jgi:hypothetical protein